MRKFLLLTFAFLYTGFFAFSQSIEFSDDFELFTNNWILEGTWGTTTTQSSSGTQSLTDSPAGNYLPNQNISATMSTGVDLSNAPNAEIRFVAFYDIEPGNFDFCYLEASSDGGSTWSTIASFLGEDNSTPWAEHIYSLSDFVGSSDVKIRFRFDSDGATEYDGIYIDDFYIISLEADETPPGVLHNPPQFYESYIGNIKMTADLIDDSGIQFAFLKYSVNSGPEQTAAGTNTIDETWSFTIPKQTEGAQVDYYLLVRDDSPNDNTTTTDVYSYIAGNHIFYDNAQNDNTTSIGPASTSGLMGCAVRITLNGTTDVIYALIRNYTDQSSPNDDFLFHIWADNNGLPGTDMITPFMVTPEADLMATSPMTRIDLSAYSAELSGLSGDFFVGYTVPTGETNLVQTTPAVANRSFNFDGSNWMLNTQSDYHFRVITTQFEAPNVCGEAANLSSMIGQGAGNSQSSPLWDNSNASVTGNEPGNGWECWWDESLDNPLWYTFTGDGGTYQIKTTNCNGTATDYIYDGDAQIAIYNGNDCNNLTAIACSDDGEIEPDIYAPIVDFETTEGMTYFIMIDGYDGAFGEYCVEITELVTCAALSIGESTGDANICFGVSTSFTTEGAVVPTFPISGFDWIVSTDDISGSSDPYNEASLVIMIGSSNASYNPILLNDGLQLNTGTYFFTPVVFGAAIDTDGSPEGLDFTSGCVETGISIEVTLYAEFDDLVGTPSSTNEVFPPGNNGEASVSVTGGSGSYSYDWSNGGDAETITGLPAGTYTVTISDDSGCVEDVVETVVVDMITGTSDLAFEQAIQLSPNPAKSRTNLVYNFNETVDLTMTMTNAIGQIVEQKIIDSALNGTIEINLEKLNDGVYFIQLTDGAHQSSKRLVVSK